MNGYMSIWTKKKAVSIWNISYRGHFLKNLQNYTFHWKIISFYEEIGYLSAKLVGSVAFLRNFYAMFSLLQKQPKILWILSF